MRSLRPLLAPLLGLAALEVLVRSFQIPEYLLPAPSVVLGTLFERPVFFLSETAVTLSEAIVGLGMGLVFGLTLGALMAHSRYAELAIYPLAVSLRATPSIAIAPIFIIWFGFGLLPKAIVAMISTFFPIVVNTMVGMRSIDPHQLAFFRTVSASPWEILWHLRVPTMLPYLFAALRLSVSLALIGAIVGELVSARHGIGYVIIVAAERLQTPVIFAGVTVLALLGIILTRIVYLVEARTIFWHESHRDHS